MGDISSFRIEVPDISVSLYSRKDWALLEYKS